MARSVSFETNKPMAEADTILCPICHKPNTRRAKYCTHCGRDVVLNNDGPRYYITRIIKQGGQGAVYETVGDDGRVYAVKEMLDRFTDPKEREEAIDRFEAEANMLQRLTHPRIPRVYAHFKDEGRHYLAMDFVRGEDLEEVLAREGAIAEPQVLEWADQICHVLAYLHNNGLIYRDMKPSNIMIDRQNGGIKIVDFGIAKVFQPTERGTQIGTPGYAPPEQYQGLATRESDIYALGATLHHLLTGRDPRDEKPFSFPPVRSLKPAVSERTANAVARALQMKPDDRYHSAEDLWNDLQPAAQVRVAQKTAALPAQPNVAAQPAGVNRGVLPPMNIPPPAAASPARPAAPPRTTPPMGLPPTSAPISPPASATQQPGVVRRFFSWLWATLVRLMIVVALVVAVAGSVLVLRPEWLSPFAEPINQVVPGLVPTAQPATLPTTQLLFEADVEAAVPAGSDAATIKQRLSAAFLAAAQVQYPGAQINPNAPPSYIGQPAQVATEANGDLRYRATLQGYIIAPQP